MDSEGVVLDRLSQLPDQILIHILSFLPIVDAVRTMLVKRFGALWTFLPNLDLNDSCFDIWYNKSPDEVNAGDNNGDDDEDDYSSLNLAFFVFVRNVLLRHRSSKITRFRVLINADTYYSDIDDRNLTPELDSWINFALRKNVEVLEFFVGMVEPDELMYKLPFTEFVSHSLTELKLEFLEMKLQTRFQMGMLRVLRLFYVEISDAVFQEIVRGCPLLQEVEIYNSTLDNLRICASNVEKLILDTSLGYYYGPIINCPNLRSFHFTGKVTCIEVQDLSSLVDVTFNLNSQNLEFKEFEQFMAALKPVLSAKTVSFSSEFVTVLFYCMLKHLPKLSTYWKRVELRMWLTEKHIPGLCRLLRNSPYLEELVIDITASDSDFLKPIESELVNYSMDDEHDCSNSLKRVVIHNVSLCSYPTLVRLINTLLKDASVLSELVICYKTDNKSSAYESVLSTEQWDEFCFKLPTFSKASEHVRVSLL